MQCAVTLFLGFACLALWGRSVGASSLAGGSIGLIANLYMTLNALRVTHSAGAALSRLLMGQLIKVVLTIGLFLVMAKMPWLSWPALLLSYLATLVVFWWVPLFAAPRGAPMPVRRNEDELNK
ncbi:MAG: ATP synthase subunit I [Steroidobacteraceae bacterium]